MRTRNPIDIALMILTLLLATAPGILVAAAPLIHKWTMQ